MPRVTRWSQLTAGVVTLVAVIAASAAVLVFARVGALHGPTTTIYMATDRASRVIGGTEVWLGGEKVGVVDRVSFRPVGVDTTQRVLITMRILNPYMAYIRRNSTVQIRSGTTLIGAPVVFITVGTPAAPPLDAGDTLFAMSQYEAQPATVGMSAIGDSVLTVIRGAREVRVKLDTTWRVVRGVQQYTVRDIGAVQRALAGFHGRATGSAGTMALALRDTARLRGAVTRLRALADSLRLAASSAHGVGRFARDTTLAGHARHAIATAEALRARLLAHAGAPTGGDSTLLLEVARTRRVLDSLVADVKHHPLRYLPF